MKLNRIFWFAAILSLVLLTGCGHKQQPLRVGLIRPSLNHLPVDVAWAQQYLDKDAFVPYYFSSGWETNEALVHGQIDVAIYPFTYVLSDATQNQNVRIVSFLERESDGIIAHRSIEKIDDLNGKKIGVLRASTLDILAEMFMESNHLSMEMVYFRTPMDLAAALQSGDVDAISFYVPSIFRFSDEFSIIHWYGDADPGHPCCNVTAHKDALVQKRSEIQKFVNGLQKACHYMETHPEETVALGAKVFQMDAEQIRASLEHLRYQMGLEESGRQFVKRAGVWMQKKGYANGEIDSSAVYAPLF